MAVEPLSAAIDWAAVTALSSAATVLVVVVGGFLAGRQLRESARSNRLEGAVTLIRLVNGGSLSRTRFLLREARPELDGLIDATGADIEAVLHRRANRDKGDWPDVWGDLALAEQIAVLALHGMIPFSFLRSYYASTLVTTWKAAEPVAHALRRQLSSDNYLRHLEAVSSLRVEMEQGSRRRFVRAARRVLRGL